MVVLTAVYANHFNNGFYFDDIHTIVNNEYVRSIQLKEYFTNIETFGTMPNNRGYRPIVTLLNAIDYQLWQGIERGGLPRFYLVLVPRSRYPTLHFPTESI